MVSALIALSNEVLKTTQKRGSYMSKIMKKLGSLLLVVTMIVSMTACGSGGNSAVGDENSITMRYALTEELNSLDPNYNYSATSMGMITNVNQGLMKYGTDGKITNGLAEKVDISEDGCIYTFTLRDAKWSNGDPVTSNDFYYSWRRLADPANGCTYAYMLITAGVKNAMNVVYGGASLDELGISCPDDKTFVVELDSPKSYFESLLCSGTYFMPVNQSYCEEQGDQFMKSKETSIYCGPYTMSDWEVGGTTYTLSKNPDYYDANNITVDKINYTLLTDEQQKILSWENGDLDQVQLSGDYITMYANDPALTTLSWPGLFFIAFNCENELLSNRNLRLAISMAIDKQQIVDKILCDGSTMADFAVPAEFAKNSEGVTYREHAGNPVYNQYNVDSAKEYFESAKSELGKDAFEIELLYNEDSQLASVAAFIQSQLQENLPGLTVNLRVTSYNQRLEDMGNGNYEMGITRWYADYQDASTYLDMWTDDSSLNYENWHNEEYNSLYEQVNGELALDENARMEAQAKMEKIFMDDAAICPLYQPAFQYLTNPNYNYVYTPEGSIITMYTTKK